MTNRQLWEVYLEIDAQYLEGIDLYLRRLGALGVSVEDPSDAIALLQDPIDGESGANRDVSIFFDPAYLEGLQSSGRVRAWFAFEDGEVAILKEARSIFDFDFEGEEDEMEMQIDEATLFERFYPQAGGQAIVEERHSLAEADDIISKQVRNYLGFFDAVPDYFFEAKVIAECDYLEAYKAHYGRIDLCPGLVVVPSWLDFEPDCSQAKIELDPESAFGTGMHATTALCAGLISDLTQSSSTQIRRALDLGTGSGILAIAMDRLLAATAEIEACDIDANAIRVAQRNFEKNHCRVITSRVASLEEEGGAYDLIVANLISDLHLYFAERYRKRLSATGKLILSGVISERACEVRAAIEAEGFICREQRERDNWVAFLFE
ncbi:MAG: 50S ribosomal protein L11 methyltransferase [Eubacteriales bacterium]|nr:50S ribosomal protein L11 methyltransferase [Eubacteriales bacterium]